MEPLFPALNAWETRVLYTTARPIATQFPGHELMDDLLTEHSFDSWVIDVLGLIVYVIHGCLYLTSHWQASGRLGQELNV